MHEDEQEGQPDEDDTVRDLRKDRTGSMWKMKKASARKFMPGAGFGTSRPGKP